METASLNVYQFKVNIRDTKPQIWRRIEVLDNYTFYELHVAIQDAMEEWIGHQWHIFEMGGGFGSEIGQCIGTPDECGYMSILPEKEERISGKFNLTTTKNCIYSQRNIFGNYVNHIIKLEQIVKALPGVKYPRCTAGRRQNPVLEDLRELEDDMPSESNKRNFSAKQIIFRDPKTVSEYCDSEED